MNISDIKEDIDTPAFRTAGGTLAGYILITTVMTILLFVVPLAVFAVL